MTRHRHATPFLASMTSSAFWSGMTLGRVLLGFVNERVGIGRATVIYILMAIGCQISFVCIITPGLSIVFMALIGFFMGPMFASGIIVSTREVPNDLHVAIISFVASSGQIGAAFVPFGIGALIKRLGIGVFGPAMILFTIFSLCFWTLAVARQQPTSFQSYAGSNTRGRRSSSPGRCHQ
jgi:fucose permease